MDFIFPDLNQLELATYMREALREAEFADQAQELPIGAVLVIEGEIVARGRARHNEARSQLSHAELNALLGGGERLWRHYRQAILFSTVKQCPMCLGAIVMADVPHVIYALHDPNVGSALTVETNPYVRRHIASYYGGVMVDESKAYLQSTPLRNWTILSQFKASPDSNHYCGSCLFLVKSS